MPSSIKPSHIPCLDGLRGLAALWVLTGHAMQLSRWQLPILAAPAYGVDLFILLSGFLMVFHYEARQAKEPWENPATWMTFWGRRFFRIAPLYYVTLALALIAGPHLGDARAHLAELVPGTGTSAARYFDHSFGNILAHVTFVFGQLPYFAFRTALPDWSIGLEMAFYAVFPFLMLATRFISLPTAAVIFTMISAAIVWGFHAYSASFDMPAFLPMKLNIFLSGMLIASALGRAGRSHTVCLALAALLALVPLWGPFRDVIMRIALVGVFAFLVHGSRFSATQRVSEITDCILSFGIFKRLGDLSYGVYLLHLLVLIPVMEFAASIGLSPFMRFATAYVITISFVYTVAHYTFKYIELPGITLGKVILAKRPPTVIVQSEAVPINRTADPAATQ